MTCACEIRSFGSFSFCNGKRCGMEKGVVPDGRKAKGLTMLAANLITDCLYVYQSLPSLAICYAFLCEAAALASSYAFCCPRNEKKKREREKDMS